MPATETRPAPTTKMNGRQIETYLRRELTGFDLAFESGREGDIAVLVVRAVKGGKVADAVLRSGAPVAVQMLADHLRAALA